MDSVSGASVELLQNNVNPLVQRFLSALLLLPLITGLIYIGYWPVALCVAVAILVALLELYTVFQRGGYQPRIIAGTGCGFLFWAAAIAQTNLPADMLRFEWSGLAFALGLLILLAAELLRHDHERSLINWALTFSGACYVGWLFSHYVLLRALPGPPAGSAGWLAPLSIPPGAAWLYCVLAITWMADTGAFFVGRQFGRRQMAPSISPHKSWEGAVGGLVAAVGTSVLAVALLGLPLTLGEMVLLGLVGGIAGPIGDLSVSLIKRQLGLKDSGRLIPGHGGVLDRMDSMLFTGPLCYYLILLLTGPI